MNFFLGGEGERILFTCAFFPFLFFFFSFFFSSAYGDLMEYANGDDFSLK